MNAIKIFLFVTFCHHSFEETSKKLTWKPPEWETNSLLQNATIDQYLSKWNSSFPDNSEINPDIMFQLSSKKIFKDTANCLTSFNIMDCLKMFLLTKIKGLVAEMETSNTTGVDFTLLNGRLIFKWRNESVEELPSRISPSMDLSRQLSLYVMRLFKSRSLQVKLFPGLGLELTPKSVPDENGLVCFSAKTFQIESADEMRNQADRKKKKRKGGGFSVSPMMFVPQLIMLGMLPFMLANLKTMVMNAFMVNSMALNGAIVMTIRNLVFGPKQGPKVKYVNYGYNKGKKNKKPELILHSPAAFVQQPHHKGYVRRVEHKKPTNHRLRAKPKPTPEPDYPPYSTDYVPQQSTQSYNPTGVDAPVSYLNNNQHLQSSATPYQNEEPFIASGYEDNYEAYNNIYLQQNENQGDDPEYKNTYSSKYNENTYNQNYYPNHRLYR